MVGAVARTGSGLEPHVEPHAEAVVDEFEVVDIFVALLVLQEVREVVTDLESGCLPPAVDDSGIGISVSLCQVDGTVLLSPAVIRGRSPPEAPSRSISAASTRAGDSLWRRLAERILPHKRCARSAAPEGGDRAFPLSRGRTARGVAASRAVRLLSTTRTEHPSGQGWRARRVAWVELVAWMRDAEVAWNVGLWSN